LAYQEWHLAHKTLYFEGQPANSGFLESGNECELYIFSLMMPLMSCTHPFRSSDMSMCKGLYVVHESNVVWKSDNSSDPYRWQPELKESLLGQSPLP